MSRSRRIKDEDYDMGGCDQEQDLYASLTAGTKRCNCKKARCLKLYCVCFAAGVFCSGCACRDCLNAVETADLVHAERSKKLAASPGAFAPKVEAKGEGELAHKKGCRCRRSRCVKKYCECYDAQVFCSGNCRCEQCQNMPRGGAPPPGLPPALLQHHHAGLAGAPMPLALAGGLPGGLLPPQLLLRSGSGAAAAAAAGSGGFNLAALAAATGAGASSNGMAEPAGTAAAAAAPTMAPVGGVSTAAAAAAAALMLEKAFGGQPLVDPLGDMEAGTDAADPLVSPPDPAAGRGGSSAGDGKAAAPGGVKAVGHAVAAAGLSERSGPACGVGAAAGPPAVAAPRPGLAASLAGLGINLDSPSLASITAATAAARLPPAAATTTAAPLPHGDGAVVAAANALAAGVAVGGLPARWSVPFLNSPDTATAAAAAAMVAEEGTGGPASQDAPGATRNPFSTAFMSRAAAEAAAVAAGAGGSSDLDATRQRGSSGGSAGGCSSDGAEGGAAPGQAPGCMGRDAVRERATRRSSSDPEDAGPEEGGVRRDRGGGIDGTGSALPLMPAPAGDPAAVAAANAGINLSVAPLTLPSALALAPGGIGGMGSSGGGATAADSVAALQDMASAAALAAASAAAAAAQSVATAIEARNASGGGAGAAVAGTSAAGLPHGVLTGCLPGAAGGDAAAAAAATAALAAGEPLTLEMVVAAPALLLDDPARAEEVAARVGLDPTLQLAARKAAHILKSLLQMAQRACLASQMMDATPAATGTTAAAPGASAMGGASGFQADATQQQQQPASAGFPGFPVPAPSATQMAAAAAALPHDPQQLQLHQQLQAYASGCGALGQLPSLRHMAVPPLPAATAAAAPDNYSHMSYSHTQQAAQGQGLQHTQPSLHAPLPSLQPQPSGTAAVGSVDGGGVAAAPASSHLPAGSQLQAQPSGGIRPLHRTGSGGGAMRLGSGSFRFGGCAGLTAAAVRPEPSAADQPSAAHHTLRTSNHSTAHPGRRASELGQPPLSATGAGARSGAGFVPSNSAQRYHQHHSHRRQSDATNGGGADAGGGGGGGLRRGSRVKRPNSLLADMEIHNDLDPDFDPTADPDAGAARRQHHAAHLPAASDRRLPHTSYTFGAGGHTLSRGRSSAEPPSPKRSRLLGEEGVGGRRGAAARRRRRGGRGGAGGGGAGYDSCMTSEDEDDLLAEVGEEEELEEQEMWGQRQRAASTRGISQSPMRRRSELSNGPLSSGGGGSALLPQSLLGTNGGPKPNSIISPFGPGASFGTHHAYGGPTGSLLSGGARPTTSEARTGAAVGGRKRRLSSGTAPRRMSIDAHDVDFLGGAGLAAVARGGGGGGPQRSCGLAAAGEVDGLGLGGLGADGDSSELEAMQALVGLATAH
ncbi:hypothetical protein HYH02_008524 [Chlamydomonas schloesseri]|uniref:CRC domain-containing protein n=1 Tax=Chlamydomonas schloesseri TaxID=2026947 RepID=A0A835WFK9_9CHLO|nr:hypothetical protein HYH02_008524 [Chlamydomonas schloesseri]|eukprot:KAG2446537.1 hypothetical protein HYH02_008524 [Chlamydomonas schloesseri]